MRKRRASRSTGLGRISMPRPAGCGARVYTAATSWPCPTIAANVGTAKSGVPMKTRRSGIGAVLRARLNPLPIAERNIPHGARRKQLVQLDTVRGQPVLMCILQQRLDARPVLRDAVGKPVGPHNSLLLFEERLQPSRRHLR